MNKKPNVRLARPLRTALVEAAIALGLMASAVTPVQAQTGRVQGRITNEVTGAPIAAAIVSVVGTTLGTLSRENGEYALVNVPPGPHVIRVELIGFGTVSQEITVGVGATATMDFQLRTRPIEMEGIVVTGTPGMARRRELGHDVSQITLGEIENMPVTNTYDVLQGRATGSVVLTPSGQVGSGSRIRLRGINSLAMGNDPLIYVDGVRIYSKPPSAADEANQTTSGLNDINPMDIERVEIVKGPAASTMYGTEASGGVIQIFTKRGTPGRPIWTLNVEQGVGWLGHVGPSEDINPTGLGLNDCTADTLGCPPSGSWLRNAYQQKYDLSVRGGTQNINYFVSGKWASENGVIAPQQSQDWAVRGNFTFDPSEDLNIQFNNSYARRDVTWIPDGDNAEGFLLNVWRGTSDYTPGHDDSKVLEMKINSAVDHFITGLTATWTPSPNFYHRLATGLDHSVTEMTEEREFGFFRVPLGNRENDTYQTTNLTLDYAGTWKKPISESWVSQFSFGGQVYSEKIRRINGFADNFGAPGDKDLDSGALRDVSEFRRDVTSGGFFLEERIGWMDRAFLTAGVRWDGFSTFGEDFGWAAYPKLHASYLISEEGFWPDWMETFKLRAALGYSGKAPGVFDAERLWQEIAGDEGQPGVTTANPGNAALGPEKTREWEFGLEGSAFDGRVSFDFSYYDQTTYDALVPIQQIPSLGFVGQQLTNIGQVSNWGTETFLSLGVLRYPNLNWDVGFRYSTHYSVADSIGDVETIAWGSYDPIIRSCGYENRRNPERPYRCYAVPGYWGDVVLNPNEVGVPPETEDRYIGPAYPTFSYGINTSITVMKRLTLDVLGEGQGGHYMISGTARQNVRRGQWPECEIDPAGHLPDDPGFTKSIQDMITDGEIENLTALTQARCDRNTGYDDWTFAADFFRLRQAALSYRIPEKYLPSRITGATLRLAARNLWLITDYGGIDPEAIEDGSEGGPIDGLSAEFSRVEYYNLPPTKAFLVSLMLNF